MSVRRETKEVQHMRSAFDSPMGVDDGVAKACGELDWDPGETEAHVTITITQKGEKVVGTASSPPNFEAGEDEWMLEVRPSEAHKKFKKGPAHAVGVINAIKDDGVEVFHWEQEVELDPDAVDET
jgi:hypothetical protein